MLQPNENIVLVEKQISRLHYLTQDLPGISHVEQVERACIAGIRWIQLRVKRKKYEEWVQIAKEVKQVTDGCKATLIINDDPHIVKEIKADGVHLGKTDMSPMQARDMVGENAIIGGTANTLEDVEQLIETGVDYIGLGPFRFTRTKENLSLVINAEKIRKIASLQKAIPVILIGGIKLQDVDLIQSLGVHGLAVSSAINLAAVPEVEAEKFVKRINEWR